LGWLLLSAKTDKEIEHILKRINYRSSRRQAHVELDELLNKVNEIRRSGFVFSKHTVVEGAGLIGMLIPLRTPDSRQLALSVHGPVVRLEVKAGSILKELAVVTNAAGVLGV